MEKIEVTQEDINRGIVRDARGCAIAAALKDILAYDISVASLIVIGKDYYKATPEVVRWWSAFDKDKKSVKPITIELVPYKFGRTYRYSRKKQPIIVCGEARVADEHADDCSGRAISKKHNLNRND